VLLGLLLQHVVSDGMDCVLVLVFYDRHVHSTSSMPNYLLGTRWWLTNQMVCHFFCYSVLGVERLGQPVQSAVMFEASWYICSVLVANVSVLQRTNTVFSLPGCGRGS
jgi:hypothetical protein